jgi:RsiW-degrading membrane proteinase PrsW (M82 family)
MSVYCPYCNKEVAHTDIFCPHCGETLPEHYAPFSFTKKFQMYFLTIALAPMGLIWFFKYRKDDDKTKRKVAVTILVLTIIMMILSAIFGYRIMTDLLSYIKTWSDGIGVYSF